MLVRLSTVTSSDDGSAAEATALAARSLLSLVHQRHFELLRNIADDVLADTVGATDARGSDDKKGRKKRTNDLLASFSLVRHFFHPGGLYLCTNILH